MTENRNEISAITSPESSPVNSDLESISYDSTSLSEILAPVQPLVKDGKNKPISYENIILFIDRCNQPKRAASIVQEYTKDIPNLLALLKKSHYLIKERTTKNRLTRIQTALKIHYGLKTSN